MLELVSTGTPFQALAAIHPGLPTAESKDWSNVTGPVLLCTAYEEPACPPEQVLAFSRSLQEAGIDWRVHVYGGAEHAFWSAPTGPSGSPAGTTTHARATVAGDGYHATQWAWAWRAVLDLFDETLRAAV
ncbi:dienelactone hydrolase family protein [Mycolicibacillus trivialis]|uniref:dienelactone hydrolase family protein n=1 Tax=Mycolicibacillus trivialis TaxID=1798 RepID=UPI001F47C19A|nr:dienelactone hydrolase family protein [Mycolicibacillus trivialis]